MAHLICGLGNGLLGRGARHAVGLRLLELLAATHALSWSLYPSIGAFVAALDRSHSDVDQRAAPTCIYLVWPMLPYNVAGWSVAAAAQRFGVPAARVTVVHDDLDKGVGELRWKYGGSAGGNNGVRSVISSLRTDSFRRLRVGIGRPSADEDPGRGRILAWVLGTLPHDDWTRIAAGWAEATLQAALLQPPAPDKPHLGNAGAAP